MDEKEKECVGIAKRLKENFYHFAQLNNVNSDLFTTINEEGQQFRDSWNNLHLDNYMGDGGKYRYRRYSVVKIREDKQLEYLPPEPHFQKKTYNGLNGDIYREYSPFEERILRGALFRDIIISSASIFSQLKKPKNGWRVECHQFRIVPSENEAGFPTPEGKHRDGVDFVLVTLINRLNMDGGKTTIYDSNDKEIASRVMGNEWESVFINDIKTMHEVSPIYKRDFFEGSYRDTLVLTFQCF
ncbi:MAG: 2OG-Fe dioxygenase family protein [Pseudomonadota bacterium]|jgi:hypothetical protein